MSIFLIGHTKTGKSTLAEKLAKRLNWTHISASEWIRSEYPDFSALSLTEFSLINLRKNPAICREFIYNKYQTSLDKGSVVIEGIRNPEDFVHLFNPKVDIVCFLKGISFTAFEEKGIEAIESIVQWRLSSDLLKKEQVFHYDIDESQETWDKIYNEIMQIFVSGRKTSGVHAVIDPISVRVNEGYLQNLNMKYHDKYLDAEIIGLSSYPGHQLTLTLLINKTSLFEYLPIQSVIHGFSCESRIDELSLAQKNCGSGRIEVIKYAINAVSCYFPNINKWMNGQYLLTVDWIDDNELLNLVSLNSGQLALVPHHKLQVGHNNFQLPSFKKLRTEWKVK